MDRFVGKIAIVTGSASGIGAAVSRKLLQNGLIVVGLDVQEQKLKDFEKEMHDDNYGSSFRWKVCNIAMEDELNQTFHWVNKNMGQVWVLVNCAGVLPRTTLLESNEKEISRTLDTNVKGLLLCNKIAANLMIENSVAGHIININSINGHYIRNGVNNEISQTMIYAASKHAVTVLTEGLRRELTRRQVMVKVSSISPGGVSTPMTQVNVTDTSPSVSVEVLQPDSVARACVKVLDTLPTELITELTIMGIHQQI